jgi:hypothetical protein
MLIDTPTPFAFFIQNKHLQGSLADYLREHGLSTVSVQSAHEKVIHFNMNRNTLLICIIRQRLNHLVKLVRNRTMTGWQPLTLLKSMHQFISHVSSSTNFL